jgi:long-chain fatty acid transport protein
MKIASLRTLSATIMGLCAGGAHAAGFHLLEQNASGIGNAYAGSAAIADNASTIFFNPAGMTYLPGVNVSAGVSAIKPSFRFSDGGSTGPGGPIGPAVGSNSGGDAGSIGAVPNAYISWQLSPQWFAGLGVGAPFGLKTEYDDDWIGRYHSKKFSIESVNINPSIAFKVNDRLSLGAGVNWMHLKADYRRDSAVLLGPPVVPGPMYLGDVGAKVKMSGVGWGWNIGMIYQATDDTRVGLSYRSTTKIKADGTTSLSGIPAPAASILPASVDAKATVKLPDMAILSLVHNLNDQWQLLADVSWTGWSSIPALDIDNGNPALNDSLELKFRDTWRVALGANYKYNEQWTFKGGVAYDQSPVRNATYRPTSLPDNDRYWLSIGAQYSPSRNTTIDIGYAHLFVKSTTIDNDTEPAKKGTVRGDYRSNANILGVQVSYRF